MRLENIWTWTSRTLFLSTNLQRLHWFIFSLFRNVFLFTLPIMSMYFNFFFFALSDALLFTRVTSSFFYYFRTIMNSNLKSIQPRAFAQNPHLRYMWVNILSLTKNASCAFRVLFLREVQWREVFLMNRRGRQRMMRLIGTAFGETLSPPLLL